MFTPNAKKMMRFVQNGSDARHRFFETDGKPGRGVKASPSAARADASFFLILEAHFTRHIIILYGKILGLRSY